MNEGQEKASKRGSSYLQKRMALARGISRASHRAFTQHLLLMNCRKEMVKTAVKKCGGTRKQNKKRFLPEVG